MNFRNILLTSIGAATMLAACGSSNGNGDQPEVPTPEPPEEVTSVNKLVVTTANRISDLTETALVAKSGQSMSPNNIRLNPSQQYQEMDGFGAAITGSTCYNLLQMTAADRKNFLTETFSPDRYGFSYVRISIGCSDFSLSDYTCCDEEGIENFALQNEEKMYIIPVLKEILEINPDLRIMGTPWTCPRWMKSINRKLPDIPFNSWKSGSLRPKYYQDYATYFVKWIQAFKAEGIDIYSVTPQNEPLNHGNSASLRMDWDEERDFVKVLGPALEKAGLDTKIFVYDHNYNYDIDWNKGTNVDQEDYPVKIYEDPEASKYIAGAAYHNYGGSEAELDDIHNKAPEKGLVFTETSIGEWNHGRDLEKKLLDDMEHVALGTVNRWCRGVIVWNLMLDTEKGPYRPGGCSTCYGAVDIDNANFKSITRNSHYYIIAHMASVVKPGAKRIGTTGYQDKDVLMSAFQNADGTYAVVLANKSNEDKQLTVSSDSKYVSFTAPAKSVCSVRLEK